MLGQLCRTETTGKHMAAFARVSCVFDALWTTEAMFLSALFHVFVGALMNNEKCRLCALSAYCSVIDVFLISEFAVYFCSFFGCHLVICFFLPANKYPLRSHSHACAQHMQRQLHSHSSMSHLHYTFFFHLLASWHLEVPAFKTPFFPPDDGSTAAPLPEIIWIWSGHFSSFCFSPPPKINALLCVEYQISWRTFYPRKRKERTPITSARKKRNSLAWNAVAIFLRKFPQIQHHTFFRTWTNICRFEATQNKRRKLGCISSDSFQTTRVNHVSCLLCSLQEN